MLIVMTQTFAPLASGSFSKCSLDTSDKEHPETHEKYTDEKHEFATPFVNVDDGGNYEND